MGLWARLTASAQAGQACRFMTCGSAHSGRSGNRETAVWMALPSTFGGSPVVKLVGRFQPQHLVDLVAGQDVIRMNHAERTAETLDSATDRPPFPTGRSVSGNPAGR